MASRRLQNIIAVIVIILAILALIYQDQIWNYWQLSQLSDDPRPVLAEVLNFKNDVKYRLPESLTYYKVTANLGLRLKDTISTAPNSTAVVRFKSGMEVEVQPNSLFIIDDYGAESGGTLELTFLRGNIRVIKDGDGLIIKGVSLKKDQAAKPQGPLRIDVIAALERVPSPPPATPPPRVEIEEKKEIKKPTITPPKRSPQPEEKEILPESYIVGVIRRQQTFLYRCYAQHLRLNPDARGRIDTSITIEPDGTVSTARVVRSTLPDPTLQQCVVTTLQRARFRSFKGDPLIISYPINFE